MIVNNIDFFNIAEVGKDGTLSRFPQRALSAIGMPEYDEAGRVTGIYTGHENYARKLTNCELRFATASDEIAVCLYAENPVEVSVYQGDYLNQSVFTAAGENELTFVRFEQVKGLRANQCNRFSPEIWRVVLNGEAPVRFLGVKAKGIRPPEPGEVPAKRILAYGSSITQGVGTPYPRLNYLSVAEQILGIEFLNKGIGSGCFCESAILEYFLTEQFDAVYLELGTNIATRPLFAIEERVGPLIDALCTRFSDKTVFLMSPIKGFSDVSNTAKDYRIKFANTRKVIAEHAAKHANAVLLDGHALVGKDYYLKADVLHPSDFGHVMMGMIFADMLKKYL